MSGQRCICKHTCDEHYGDDDECESDGSMGTGCACESYTPCEHPPGQAIHTSRGTPCCKMCSTHWSSDEAYAAETGHAVPNLDRYMAL